ncbi:hypothetical protein ACFQ46_01615 [Kineococcus sp. GCM10028916]|uniref:hypothetical protein n=1 Tax=Kineococcus sp. GCM10028916 TaxID=3273394 RepID=UPI003633FA73
MPARRRHRRPRPGPPPPRFVLDATDLLAPPPGRPDPNWGLPRVLWSGKDQPPFDWPAALADLHRHLLLPDLARETGHHVEVTALGTRVVATHLDGRPLQRGEPTSVLRAHHVLAGHRRTLEPAHVLAYARLHADLAPHLPGMDLTLVLAAAHAGLSAAEIVQAHRDGTLTLEKVELLAALLPGWA